MKKLNQAVVKLLSVMALGLFLSACSHNLPTLPSASVNPSLTENPADYKYLIGPGDELNIFVWRNPEISGTFIVRPDGMVSTSLVEDLEVSGKTPTELARLIESELAEFIRDPIVTVTVEGFIGPFSEQVRVIGEAFEPQAINYREDMTLLDVMIQVGGLTEYADGDNARLVRVVSGEQRSYNVRVGKLIQDGEIEANVDVLPGDIIIIPEAWF
ncbi:MULTISPECIES: XrtA/PEP-CTERM system exopolysaccharide export protein [unclassified Agarivorans]|uniref:XrtA/PEP-CTERM system exopolysaccharide export protein n=1 Tax=unclassified Agarivorans TaxID=2636026 RepID=UPI0026E41C93|nr:MULTISPECIES: XrtA/PEP-CTERM system exopolysaccharide export protein [unclassified Agarivorans]MDO6687729.1 polysaccharide biosynthesis/export family protein [Agarivorans sp. 3_MG-2023]MDO6717270.1 polysaccharide biosynthesis/export family protein [Agarivorans sp. 2_MG-2023]